jgi:hypothetical protein
MVGIGAVEVQRRTFGPVGASDKARAAHMPASGFQALG